MFYSEVRWCSAHSLPVTQVSDDAQAKHDRNHNVYSGFESNVLRADSVLFI